MNVYTSGRLTAVEYWAPVVGPIPEGYKYDQVGAVTLKRMDQSGTSWPEAGYMYDNEGRMMTTHPSGGKTYTRMYDPAGRPSGMTLDESGVAMNDVSGVGYNAAAQMTALAYQTDGFNYSDGFTNNLEQLTNPTIFKNGGALVNFTYTYPAANEQQWTHTYTYDGFANTHQ